MRFEYENPEERAVFGFAASAVSDSGCVGLRNEDNYVLGTVYNAAFLDHSEAEVCFPDPARRWQLAGVFDGIGTGEKGKAASTETAEVFCRSFCRLMQAVSRTEADLILCGAFLEANNRILLLQRECRILGTTATVLCASGTRFKIYHMGDSRAYLIRGQQMIRLTKDQTLEQLKKDAGLYREGELPAPSDRNQLTQYVGQDWSGETLQPEQTQWLPIQPGDQVLLCTDGLYSLCPEAEIAKVLFSPGSLGAKTKNLTKLALSRGGRDDITCILAAFV